MGRRPKPAEMHTMAGTWRPDRHAPPAIGAQRAPEAVLPRHLSGDAREFWTRHAVRLRAAGLLDVDSAPAFERLCQVWAEVRGYDAYLAEHGTTYETGSMVRTRPQVALRSEADKRLRQYLIEFGLTPAARTKVPRAPVDTDAPDDPIDRYLNS